MLQVNSLPVGMSLEDALDFFRSEGEWEPCQNIVPQATSSYFTNRFVNQCGRCLEFRQAVRVDLSRNQRVWLCQACRGQNPPVVIVPQTSTRTYQEISKTLRAEYRAKIKEEKKRDREARKARDDSMPKLRRDRSKARDAKNPESESA